MPPAARPPQPDHHRAEPRGSPARGTAPPAVEAAGLASRAATTLDSCVTGAQAHAGALSAHTCASGATLVAACSTSATTDVDAGVRVQAGAQCVQLHDINRQRERDASLLWFGLASVLATFVAYIFSVAVSPSK
mmetsp:Transcript_83555/g.250445  ORF Transcript_83555/g.250445 Transcript_83555/m.250445 type:complete len:134 (+) Transcript_83555:497-898(+)